MPRVAYVHDWLVKIAGAENVLVEMLKVYKGRVFTLFYSKSVLKQMNIEPSQVKASFLNKFPFVEKYYRALLPFFPLAISSIKVRDVDIVVSSSHAVSNGVSKDEGIYHISYCHTPMRYVWTHVNSYRRELSFWQKKIFDLIIPYLRNWDLSASKQVDLFIATSSAVKERIKRVYNRDSMVIHPPVRSREFSQFFSLEKEDYYLYVGRLDIPYKKVDIVIKAFNNLKKKLLVVGDGFDAEKLKKLAGDNIQFLGWRKGKELASLMSKARALILPSEEDFGIVSVEAQACGTPVIAYGKGGVLDTVIPYRTGIFFHSQTVSSLIDAVSDFERIYKELSPIDMRNNALRFDSANFREKFKKIVDSVV